MSRRVETGVLKFGDDWSGVFVRGDSAAGFALALRGFLDSVQKEEIPSPLDVIQVEELLGLLEGSRDDVPRGADVVVQRAKSADDCLV